MGCERIAELSEKLWCGCNLTNCVHITSYLALKNRHEHCC